MKNNFLILFLLFTAFGLQSAAQDVDSIYLKVDENAHYPGGEDMMLRFLATMVEYPEEAMQSGIVGMVYVEFVVNTDGSLEDYKVVRDIGGGCGEEVIRALKRMPLWKPAMHEGKVVRQVFTLPVGFENDRALKNRKKKRKNN